MITPPAAAELRTRSRRFGFHRIGGISRQGRVGLPFPATFNFQSEDRHR